MSRTDIAFQQLCLALAYKLEGADFALDVRNSMSDDEFAALYNGAGPERWAQEVRAKIGTWLVLFLPAVFLHDIRFSFADGTRIAFNFANMEFRDNCRALADLAYPWYSLKRYRARAVGKVLYACVASPAGWQSWMEKTQENAVRAASRQNAQPNVR